MRIVIAGLMLAASTGISFPGCELVTGPCSTDSSGNTYFTEQNLGGGYNTYRNGDLSSQTSQNLGGSYTETFSNGATRTHSDNPYGSQFGQLPTSQFGTIDLYND
ncbi:hypothetical protein ACG873_21820 [Mesorhizobium sp. AaZ16]|uniref:hypothetical protein n=1 Tax=Mesorhizobium sp. AaZ16 TaxID=3402289 RepID=UPI00374FB461